MKLTPLPILITAFVAFLPFAVVSPVISDTITYDNSYVEAYAVGTVGVAYASVTDNNNPYCIYAEAPDSWTIVGECGGWFGGDLYAFAGEVDTPGIAECVFTAVDFMQNISASCTARVCFVGPGAITGPSVWRSGDSVVLSCVPSPATHQTTDPMNNLSNPTQLFVVGHENMLIWAYRPCSNPSFQPIGGNYIDTSNHVSHLLINELPPGDYVIGVTAATSTQYAYGGTTPWNLAQTKRVHVLPPSCGNPNGCPTQ
jgi:hypothetical protein